MIDTSRVRIGLATVLFLCALGQRAKAAVELEGEIRGRIVEAETNAAIPGATVTVTSPGLGYPRTVTTNEDGEYLVPNLPIGHYTVTVSYSGVKPVTREVLVQPGTVSPLDIKWSAELAGAETTTVVEERPVTNPDSTQTGTVLSNDQEKFIPTARRYTDVVRQVPGVTTNPTGVDQYIKGGRTAHNRYLIDGLDVTDPVRRTAQQELPFDSIEAVQVITGGFDAEYNVFGGIINTITREGSDEWHGSASLYVTNDALSNRKPLGTQEYQVERTFDESPVSPTYEYRTSLTLGGPIIKHQLWFNTTFEYRYRHAGRLIGPPLYVPKVPRTDTTYLPRLKLTWAPSSKQRITLSLAADPQFQNNTAPGAPDDTISTYMRHTDQGGYNAVLVWSIFPSSNFEFLVDAGIKTQYINAGPQGWFGSVDTTGCDRFSPINCTYDREAAPHTNATDNTIWYNARAEYDRDLRTTVQIDPKIILRGHWFGEHTAKVGIQFKYLYRSHKIHDPGPWRYSDSGGGPLESGLCDPDAGKIDGCNTRSHQEDRNFHDTGFSPALFLQDKWRVLSWLTISPGIRFDYGESHTTDGTLFHSQFAVGPRLGLIADLTRDQKTIFSTAYGRANEVSEIGNASDYDANLGVNITERYDKAARQWVFQSKSGGQTGGIIDHNAQVPHVDSITTSLRREIYRNAVAGVEHTWKRISTTWDKPEINRIWDAAGQRVIGYVDGVNHTVFEYTTQPAAVRNYQGITFSVEGRPTPNWYFLAFYTLSWLYGTSDAQNTTDFYIPQQRKFYQGWLPQDNRHQMHVTASYTFHGLTVGAYLEYISGRPQWKSFRSNEATSPAIRRTPRGTEPGICGSPDFIPQTTVCGNDLAKVADFRTPARAQLDLHVEYDFYELLRQHIALMADIFNLFNDRSAEALNEADNVQNNFGGVSNHYGSLNIRLGARYEF
jgi:hypothetical protein